MYFNVKKYLNYRKKIERLVLILDKIVFYMFWFWLIKNNGMIYILVLSKKLCFVFDKLYYFIGL